MQVISSLENCLTWCFAMYSTWRGSMQHGPLSTQPCGDGAGACDPSSCSFFPPSPSFQHFQASWHPEPVLCFSAAKPGLLATSRCLEELCAERPMHRGVFPVLPEPPHQQLAAIAELAPRQCRRSGLHTPAWTRQLGRRTTGSGHRGSSRVPDASQSKDTPVPERLRP